MEWTKTKQIKNQKEIQERRLMLCEHWTDNIPLSGRKDIKYKSLFFQKKICVHSVTTISFKHSFIHLFNHSYMYSYFRLFIHSFIHLYRISFIHPFIHPFIHSFIHLFIYSFIHSSIHSSIHPLMHPFIYSFIHSVYHIRSFWLKELILPKEIM